MQFFSSALASLALTAILGWCAFSDVKTRKIPNRAVIAVLGLYALWALAGGAGSPWWGGLAAGTIALAACFALFCFGVFGAGDAKLFAAVALFTGLKLLPLFAVATALSGGVLLAIALAMEPRRMLLLFSSRGRLGATGDLPYGVAIAAGGILVQWGRLLGFLEAGA